MSKEEQQAIANQFENPPILYISGLVKIFDVNTALLLSQLLYWNGMGKSKDGYIYKTAKEIKYELGLSYDQQTRAIKKLKAYRILETKLAGIPAKRHFKVNTEVLITLITAVMKFNNKVTPEMMDKYMEKYIPNTKSTAGRIREESKEYQERSRKAVLSRNILHEDTSKKIRKGYY